MFDELIAANRARAVDFDLHGLPARAARNFGLVTCMDSRIDPLRILGLRSGDAKFIRNAGGRVTSDVLRSLVLATNLLDVRYVAVMHHTECALAGRDDEEIERQLVEQGSSAGPGPWLSMPDPDLALAQDVAAIQACEPLRDGLEVEGWRYDVRSGLIDRVLPTAHRR